MTVFMLTARGLSAVFGGQFRATSKTAFLRRENAEAHKPEFEAACCARDKGIDYALAQGLRISVLEIEIGDEDVLAAEVKRLTTEVRDLEAQSRADSEQWAAEREDYRKRRFKTRCGLVTRMRFVSWLRVNAAARNTRLGGAQLVSGAVVAGKALRRRRTRSHGLISTPEHAA